MSIEQGEIDELLELYSVVKRLSQNPTIDEKRRSNYKSEYQMLCIVFGIFGIDPDEELRKENR